MAKVPKEPGGVLPSVKVEGGIVSVRLNEVELTMGADESVLFGQRLMNAGWRAADQACQITGIRRRKRPPES
jgi:hypothetical protein